MSLKQRLDLTSAYGQLILLVFLPICLLAMVGAVLVYTETSRASHNEQQAIAQALLLRYEPAISEQLSVLAQQDTPIHQSSSYQSPPYQPLHQTLLNVKMHTHVHRIGIIDDDGQIVHAVGYQNDVGTEDGGTEYKRQIIADNNRRYWLIINMDNEPIDNANLRIMLALAVTGLFTILMLLLSINGYAKRWVAPIYEMRMYLQRVTIDTLYQPIAVRSEGEINLLQQDLVYTLRRVYSSFQELKEHAEQTEADLRQAFDAMEMQNISIRNARDAAITASAAKSAFLANISHELRTPLNSIDGFSNLLARHGKLSDEQDLYVQTIRKSSAHLLALVNDVLDFSKIEAGKLELEYHEFSLYDVIYDVADMLSPLASEKGLRLAVNYYHDVPMRMVGDALRIKQVLTNLVGNAIKFTDVGQVLIQVRVDEDKDNQLLIAIQDTGRGVAKEDQAHLFQSFSQGDPSTTRQYGGTGLGLVISKQLTRLWGGQIGYWDNEQHNLAKSGSTFWFGLPTQVNILDVPLAADMPLPILKPIKDLQASFHSKPYRLLVWLESDAVMHALTASLQPLPIHLTQAYGLAELLTALKEHAQPYDYVIVDTVNNTDSDGMTALLKQIRLHYQGDLALYGYQVAIDMGLLSRYQAAVLYEPFGKRQFYGWLDSQKRPTSKPEHLPWQGKRVLAVDDHLPNLLVLDALLAEMGIDVVTATNGFDALEIISSFRQPDIDLIFMDIQMPKMSGHQTAQQIRKIESNGKRRRTPIIALSAHSVADEKANMATSGMDDFIGKPISRPQLQQVLQRWLTPPASAINDLAKASISSIDDKQSHANTNHHDNVNNHDNVNHHDNADKITDTHTDKSIDWQDALTRAAHNSELAVKLLHMMQDGISDDKDRLQRAWQACDREELAQISHRILGASRYTGVPKIRQASQDFEDKCLLNVKQNNPSQMAMLSPSYELLLEALKEMQTVDLASEIAQQQNQSSHEPANHALPNHEHPNTQANDANAQVDKVTWKML